MRRGRNEADTGDRMPQTRDHVVRFVSGKLATLAGLRALRHLDLKFVGVDEVICSHTEACRCHLLDRAATPVTVRIFVIALFIFAALAGIRLPADAVHGDGEGLVRFLAD